MQTQPSSVHDDRVNLPIVSTIEADQTDLRARHALKHEQLSSEDYVELTRISRKKDDIEQHIANLQSWPSWDPFKDVASYSADVQSLKRSKDVLDGLKSSLRDRQDKCNRLEHDIQQFNVDEMKRLRTVAKAISKRHLSGPDTDLLELALETVYALDKLLRLLRERRIEHDLTELRLQWETTICSSWADVVSLRRDIDSFEQKCNTLMVSKLTGNSASLVEADPSQARGDGATTIDTTPGSDKKRVTSLTYSSVKLATESVKLEASRLVLRVKSFGTEKVRSAGRLLDLLIDQRQVPEKLIDEQEKLEDALPQPLAIEAKSLEIFSRLNQAEASDSKPEITQPRAIATGPSVMSVPILGIGDIVSDLPSRTNAAERNLVPVKNIYRSISIGARSRQTSFSSTTSTPVQLPPNRYRSDPRDALDIAVGRIVNRMPISVSVKSASFEDIPASYRSSTRKDLSGQYWIGDPEPRLCFCRVLPSNLVMVRVGGGWQELSQFLKQHYAHLSARGIHEDDKRMRECAVAPASHLTWLRSASGPVESPRLRSKSSVGSLRLHDSVRVGSPSQPMRMVTMPTMRTNSILRSGSNSFIRDLSSSTPEQAPIEHSDISLSTSRRNAGLSSSDSGSSIIIRSLSPSL
ncbi:uncharacterized protein MEPE_00271 [Melanopsichium pennsylvanicum]|uniref:GAR domain-containing protein n=2 Tax=Melanopsichium pennsylvanicum TaxID=63383 RepID=A0AAJ4XH07_9BASI|nr:uncharacterized protein MEPE_00271 [Melanopsichium pennsylvanicum]